MARGNHPSAKTQFVASRSAWFSAPSIRDQIGDALGLPHGSSRRPLHCGPAILSHIKAKGAQTTLVIDWQKRDCNTKRFHEETGSGFGSMHLRSACN